MNLSLCLSKHHAIKTYLSNGGVVPFILNLGARWRSVVTFTPRPLFPELRVPVSAAIVYEAGWAQEPVSKQWQREEIPSLLLQGIEPRSFSP
jgi:hypothetical protein